MSRLARTCMVGVAFIAVASACGHLPFDELPVDEAALVKGDAAPGTEGGTSSGDSGRDGDVPPIDRDGGIPKPDAGDDDDDVIETDGGSSDGGLTTDGAIDSGIPIGACVTCGPNDIFVSPSGKDSNLGTVDAPVATITKALTLVKGQRIDIRIEVGKYPESLDLKDKVSMHGGYHVTCPVLGSGCVWTAPTGAIGEETVIVSPSNVVGTLILRQGVTDDSVFEDLHVIGADGSLNSQSFGGGAAVALFRATPTLRRMTIEAGNVSVGAATPENRRAIGLIIAGMSVPPTGAVVDTCLIRGGTTTVGNSVGVLVSSIDSNGNGGTVNVTLKNSQIFGMSGSFSHGVELIGTESGTVLDNNDISSAVSTAAEPISWGVTLTSGKAKITHNRINVPPAAGGAAASCSAANVPCGGVMLSNPLDATLQNNVIVGARAPDSVALLFNITAKGDSALVTANDLFGYGDGSAGSKSAAVGFHFTTNAGPAPTLGTLRGNIFDGGNNTTRYGVYEGDLTGTAQAGHPAALTWNDFAHTDVAYRYVTGGNQVTTYHENQVDQIPGQIGSVGGACALVAPPNDVHLVDTDTKCKDAWPQPGTDAPAIDTYNDARPNGPAFDIGAAEAK